MGSGLSYRNHFSHFSCLFKQTVLRENLSKDLNGLKSLRLLVSQQHVQVQCCLICFCSKLTSALRFANLRFIVPQCLEPIDVQEFVHRMEARKEFEKICLNGFLSKKLLQIPFQTRFQALDYPGDPAELAAQLCKAPTLLTRTGAPLACWYVAYLYQFVHMIWIIHLLSVTFSRAMCSCVPFQKLREWSSLWSSLLWIHCVGPSIESTFSSFSSFSPVNLAKYTIFKSNVDPVHPQ